MLAATGELETNGSDQATEMTAGATNGADSENASTGDDSEGRSRRAGRRRGRRGGRRNERDGLDDGSEGSRENGSKSLEDTVSASGQTQMAGAAAPSAVEIATREESPMYNAQPLDFSRDGDHPEKPDQFEPAPVPKPTEAPKPTEPKNDVANIQDPPAEVEAAKPRRADPVAGAPVLARVVVSIDGTPAAAPAVAADDKPVRKGWWQRKLAGE